MTLLQLHARLHLTAALLSALAVAVLYGATRNLQASLAGFALLAIPALLTTFRPDLRTPVQDERDAAIERQSRAAGHTAVWLGLVAWGVAVPLTFADRGSVPLVWVSPVLWGAWWLYDTVRAVTLISLDRSGS